MKDYKIIIDFICFNSFKKCEIVIMYLPSWIKVKFPASHPILFEQKKMEKSS